MVTVQEGTLTIQQAAKATGVSIHTLRYYERIDLLEPVARAANGHRRYSREDVERIITLNTLRLTGMSLEQIRDYWTHMRQSDRGVAARIELLKGHRKLVAERVEMLNKVLDVIDTKLRLLEEQPR